ncbi:MAG: leucyl aminopeptidase, partial [Alphaproteobacteria bacterium]|nr:leucyl aminopeptidase [Alphaproteobacteria bacterium]
VVAALALAENMISDDGYRPSDILKSLSGQTIEVTNTDAEGRLVLCDAMWHVQKTYKPRAMVDIATLTGAAMVALGEEFAGLFSNDDVMRDALEAASHQTGDRVWRMPLDKAFDRAMDSNIADMKNAAATRYGGSCTAAAFLQRFVEKGVKWAHVDMAPVMVARADAPLCPRGATGFGVRLLSQWAQDA